MHYVIIGNSAGAVGCIEGIRSRDKENPITLIASEAHHTYSRPLISYLLAGKTTLGKMRYRPLDFYEKNNVTPLLGRTVTAIDPAAKVVTCNTGETIAYDKLLVATGSRPFIPKMEGLDTVSRKFTFMSLDDATALSEALFPAARVLIVGAGLIGLKCAEGIRHLAGDITVVDLSPRILPSILDEAGAAIVQQHIEKQGVRFILSASAARFEGDRAILTNGETVEFDLLILAVGVRPNTALIEEAGGGTDRGVLTDGSGKTSLSDVYAAGDCTQSYDVSTGQSRVLALLPNAYMQGECAGICMAGGDAVYNKAIPMNAIGFFGLHIITAGNYDGETYIEKDEDAGQYKLLATKDGLLKGYILIGNIERAGIYTSLIRERTPLDTVDFDLIRQHPQLMAFSTSERAKKMGGAT